MTARLVLGNGDLDAAGLAAAARAGGPVWIVATKAVRERIAAARAIVDEAAQSDAPVYGLNTGLGANLGHRIAADAVDDFQTQVLAGRVMAVGEPLPLDICRACFLALIANSAHGAAGLSPALFDHLIAMAGVDIWPVVPAWGSVGDSDLTVNAHMGWAAIGRGEVWVSGAPAPAADALARAGLTPPVLGAKDGMALINHSATSVGRAACAVADARRAFETARATAALAAEGYAMNPDIFSPHVNILRRDPQQALSAIWFRRAFDGSSMAEPGAARKIQDALSFRLMAVVFGSAEEALIDAEWAVERDLNGATDSPAVLIDRGTIASTPNFHSGPLALALEGLRLAFAHLAAASAQRVLKLMKPDLSDLPKYLSPVGGAAAGYVPLQKTTAALLADIRRCAHPVTLDAIAVSDMVEDLTAHTPLAAQALADQLRALRLLTAVEALVAAQAVDLRAPERLGPVAGRLHAAIRERVPTMTEDRPGGPDVDAVADVLDGLQVGLDPA